MNYVLLDLEWNSAYCKATGKFVNEIVQIGAVKLNEKLEFVEDISIMVRSSLTKRLSGRFKDLTGISNEDMLAGVSFSDAVDKYNEWVKTDFVTLTWSNSDLFAIIENCRLFADGKLLKMEKYVDLQGYVQDWLHRSGHEFKGQISLSTAAELAGIDFQTLALHTARDDSLLSSELLRMCFDEKRLLSVARDASRPEFYDRLLFKPYNITSVNDAAVDKDILRFKCNVCGNYAKRRTKWSYKNHWFSATFKCSCGNKFIGRLALKKHYDCVVTKRMILPATKKSEKNERMHTLSEKM